MNHPELNKISYPTRWSCLSAIVAMLVAPVFLLSVDRVFAAQYLNCLSEPRFNSGDSTVLMCDDFENGTWYVALGGGSRKDPANDGWEGDFFTNPPDGMGFGRCGALGAVGTNCTATTGQRTGTRASAMHWFAPNENTYPEIYHRFYTKFLPGYKFGHEKLVFYQRDDVGGQVGYLGTPFGQPTFAFIMMPPNNNQYDQNQGNNITITPGHWYYVEVRIKLDMPMGSGTGILQLWADDCGTSGSGCTGPGTLRLSFTGLNIRPSNSYGLGVINQENWGANTGGNAVSVGEVYNDQVIVRTQRIGPIGVMQPPSNLKAQ